MPFIMADGLKEGGASLSPGWSPHWKVDRLVAEKDKVSWAYCIDSSCCHQEEGFWETRNYRAASISCFLHLLLQGSALEINGPIIRSVRRQ